MRIKLTNSDLKLNKTNSLRRLFIENVKISNIIKNFINVYNIKKAIKFANKTLIIKKSKLDTHR